MDKFECLKNINIGQSAAKPRIEERSETISKESSFNENYCETGDLKIYHYIYFLIHPITMNIVYIGRTNNPLKRFGNHLTGSGSGNKQLQK
jgi:hypothetical protein